PPKRRTTCSTTTAGSAGGRGIGGRSSCSTKVSTVMRGSHSPRRQPERRSLRGRRSVRSSDCPYGSNVEAVEADLAHCRREGGVQGVAQAYFAGGGDVPLAIGHDAAAGADFPGLPFRGAPVEQRYREWQVGLPHAALDHALDVQAQLAQL